MSALERLGYVLRSIKYCAFVDVAADLRTENPQVAGLRSEPHKLAVACDADISV